MRLGTPRMISVSNDSNTMMKARKIAPNTVGSATGKVT
jgi:hypothetical protein